MRAAELPLLRGEFAPNVEDNPFDFTQGDALQRSLILTKCVKAIPA